MTTNPPTAVCNAADQITLSDGQQTALDRIWQFLLDPNEPVFVLKGYSGCGKSTLIRTLIDRLPGFVRSAKLISPSYKELEVAMTATTNKAAENLADITGMDVKTIHSFLGLRVSTDYKTGKTSLVPKDRDTRAGYFLFIDEASYIDKDMLDILFKRTANCKIVFVGDPAQLTPVLSSVAPAFQAGFPEVELNQVMRQAEGNPIIKLSTQFRHTVNTGEWLSFQPDGKAVVHLDRAAFIAEIEKEFTRADWKYKDSKILAWTNKCVVSFNHHINNLTSGTPNFQPGDYAVCNSFVTLGRQSIKTDQTVLIMGISPDLERHGVTGNLFTIEGGLQVFMPKSREEKAKRLKRARATDEYGVAMTIENEWADLRAAFSQTINKSQGSTYDRVYIDLDDVARCNNGNQVARMLYVGASRARHQVFFTGDLA